MAGKPRTIVFLMIHASSAGSSGPLGVGCVAAKLVKDGIADRENIVIIEASVEDDETSILDEILSQSPEVAGFSLYCWNTLKSLRIAEALKRRAPSVRLIAGGPDAVWAASAPESVYFDALFQGEAETAVAAWFSSGDSSQAAMRNHKASELVSPWLEGVLEPSGESPVAWELSRGCPFHCTYCYEGRGERGVRHFPMERIKAELSLFADRGVREIFVLDPTFNVNKKRSMELLSLFGAMAPDIGWNFEVRAELVDEELAEAFASLDTAIQIGLQSSNAKILSNLGRSMDREKFASGIGYLDAAGVVYGFDLIYGLPGDRLEAFMRSLDFALSLRPNHVDIFPLSVLPGTELHRNRDSLGLVADPRPPYILESHADFPVDDMRKARTLADSVGEFYSRGRAVPWFLAVTRALGMKPSAFFESYRGTLRDFAKHSEIEIAQREHVKSMFARKDKDRLAPVADELIRYHGAWSRAFAEKKATTLELAFRPGDLDIASLTGLERLAEKKRPHPSRVEIYPSGNGPSIREIRA